MENKLYSRRRISLKAPKKVKLIKIFVFLFFTLIIFSVVSFFRAAYPIFKASCETAAKSLTIKTINSEVNNLMKNYSYDDLVNVDKDVNGKVNFVRTNTKPVNEIMTQLAINVQKDIDDAERTNVYINLGSVSGISLLKYIGPKFNIELETSGNVETKLNSKFTAVGINQTLHELYLNVSTKITVLTPFGSFGKPINTDVLLVESVIVGEIPDTYYHFTGEADADSAFEIME